ncbi:MULTISPECIES: polyphosphate kinase 1 [unclassified Haloferax]|uniref:polyphosphate kinase 1 n=1 Tax=unclassified Haloferax TaxID=2625095 RepID=UPI000E252BF0|nr:MULTISPECIES: polyphosphate kinase 1 [unclassified Haloferax]RDZ34781.1 polyphosphate kinase 1 [Haloferax sp. Atlit-24N]RLM35192.1 polyphosphate kinase 1 [Haloferax sp. Atlit-109R]RLM43041.1 polyphosphate kinase 1 [Haloferax sp. Atlit-105R]
MSDDEPRGGDSQGRHAGQSTAPVRARERDGDAPEPADADLADPALYLNRELSELAFHERVLHEARDDRNPLFERVKFLSILTSNLDEFFMKRVGGLKQQMAAGVSELSPDGRTPSQQWSLVLDRARDLLDRQSDCFHDLVRPALTDAGIDIVGYDDLAPDERAALRDYFEASVLPTLTPLTFEPAHPFPFISNLSLSLAVRTTEGPEEPTKFSRVKVPGNRPRLVNVDERVGDAGGRADDDGPAGPVRFVPLVAVIERNIDLLFPNVEVVDTSAFRVTRNAEVRRNEEVAEGLIATIEDVLRQRRFATVVRLEVQSGAPEAVRDLLAEQLGVDDREVFERDLPLDYGALASLFDLDRPELEVAPWTPQPHPRFAGRSADDPDSVFTEIARKDVLVHHPYHSFTGTVGTFLAAAAADPDVLAIKATIYRTAPDSEVIETLIEAAKNGKQVAVMVELKARFDEENNLRWVRRLEEEGIHVAYGTIGLKTHTKTALVVREEGDEVRLYSHVATGNYHSQTAKLYTDLGLFTADPDIGHDLVRLFNFFTGHSRQETYRKLLVAPTNLREEMTRLVRREADHARAGRDARIVAKMNALEDPAMVRELYEASMAGVDIDLVVRGICRLRPGIEGLSEHVSVSSVVGRFLEHSRIFYFENGGEPDYYVGSADWMTRNLDRRVEAVAPVEDPEHRAELDAVLDALLSDNRRRWVMDSDGRYEQRRPGDGEPVREAHRELMDRALGAAYRAGDD